MEKNFVSDNELFDNELECDECDEFNEKNFYPRNKDFYPIEIDLYQSSDDRVWESNVEDIDGGDNFADYCKYIFGVLAEEEYFDCQ